MKLTKILFFTTIFLIYISTAPFHVQGTDTGELVTNAYLWRLSHPPGYPLYHLIYYFFSHLISFKSIYFRASVITIFISLITLFILMKRVTTKTKQSFQYITLLLILVLAFSPNYWKYSLLPEVMGLTHLFIIILSVIYFSNPFKGKNELFAFFLMLGLTHQLTLIFFFPLFLFSLKDNSLFKINWMPIFLFSILGLSIYPLLLGLETNSMTSWGGLKNWKDLWGYWLRKDYGTFSLSTKSSQGHFLDNIKFLVMDTLIFYYPFIVIFFSLIIYQFKNKKRKIFPLKDIFYLEMIFLFIFIFFSLAGLPITGPSRIILERFILFPQLMFICFILFNLQKYWIHLGTTFKNIFSTIGFLALLTNFYQGYKKNNYHNQTIIEDWAINRLNCANPKAIIVENSDVGLFSLYYVQNILKISPKAKIISTQMLFHDWYKHRIGKNIPSFKLQIDRINGMKNFHLEKDFILPNISRIVFNFSNTTLLGHPEFLTIIKPIGIEIYQHNQEKDQITLSNCHKSLVFNHIANHLFPRQNYQEDLFLFSKYSYFHLEKALKYYKNRNLKSTRAQLNNTISFMPFCLPALKNLCELDNQSKENCATYNHPKSQGYNYWQEGNT